MTTESIWQTVGPFFHEALPWEGGADLTNPKTQGTHIQLIITALDGNGDLVSDGMIELWQADTHGSFNHPDDARGHDRDPNFSGFGRGTANQDGQFVFNTIIPGRVLGPGNTLQAPHIDVSFFSRGLVRRLVSRIYFEGQPGNDEDPVMGLIDPARRSTLIARKDPSTLNEWHWTIRLQGDNETVFFSV
jgi:protocatechuate 3,4-dioxygenase alpha subunit